MNTPRKPRPVSLLLNPAARKSTPIRTADVLKKFSQNGLGKLLGISRAAIQHWGEYIPEHRAQQLRAACPHWRRLKDFDRRTAILGGRRL